MNEINRFLVYDIFELWFIIRLILTCFNCVLLNSSWHIVACGPRIFLKASQIGARLNDGLARSGCAPPSPLPRLRFPVFEHPGDPLCPQGCSCQCLSFPVRSINNQSVHHSTISKPPFDCSQIAICLLFGYLHIVIYLPFDC